MTYWNDDEEKLANQPIGYWTWAANKTVSAYVRGGSRRSGSPSPSGGSCTRCSTARTVPPGTR